MANTARKTTKTVTKHYDTMLSNDFNLNFEYEVENGILAPKITVNGFKDNTSVFIQKTNNQLQTIFSNGDYDAAVVQAVTTEFEAIAAQYAVVPPIEG